MEQLSEQYKHIIGWGVDADPQNEPTYPMKTWTGDDHRRRDYRRSEPQPITVEVLHSNERPDVSVVYGTSSPPVGLSGALRRYAFRYSESSWGHWLPLILADRVNVVEGIVSDLARGHVPNIFAEKGWKAEWKYNRAGLMRKVGVMAAVAIGVGLLIGRKKDSRD